MMEAEKQASQHPRTRKGKTERDKANGHIPGKKNRRVWRSNPNNAPVKDSNGHVTTGNWEKT